MEDNKIDHTPRKLVVRKSMPEDMKPMVEIWYQGSIQAHHFIPATYWQKNKEAMESLYLPSSESYVATAYGEIVGFVALVDQYLAAIFVTPTHQGKGIGKTLMAYVQNIHSTLALKVYIKNESSVRFYEKQGFTTIDKSIDEATGEEEFVMQWKK